MSQSSIPSSMKALVAESKGVAKVASVPVPKLKAEESEVLIKVAYVALNPTDWKHLHNMSPPGAIMGCDFAGQVASIAEGSKDTNGLKVGDRVAGFVHGSAKAGEDATGSFAEYLRTPASLVWKVPSSVPFEEAAAIGGIASETAVHALYLRLNFPAPGSAPGKDWFLVWGGSTSVGQYAIQLAHASGLKVVTVASPRNHDLVRKLGADEVFDYNDKSTPSKIRDLTSNSITSALDCISEKGSFELIQASVSDKGAKVITLLPIPEDFKKQASSKGVEFENILVYTTRGKEFNFGPTARFPASKEDREGIEKWLKEYTQLTSSGQLKSNPLKRYESLEKIPEGLDYLKEGKASAEKLVYKV